jgi:hypothetical protein
MQYMVAFVPLHGQRFAVVEVLRDQVGDAQQQKLVQEQLAKVPELEGHTIVLAVPHAPGLEADFLATNEVRMALKKMGWLQLGFHPTKLTLAN